MYEHIRGLREDNELTQQDLANYLKIHQTTYSDYELGNINIPIAILVNLAILFDTSIDYLIGITDEKEPYKRSLYYKSLIQKERAKDIT